MLWIDNISWVHTCCGRGDALSHCCGLVVAFACGRARGMDARTTERYAGKRPARHFKRLKPVKRQPWTPIRIPPAAAMASYRRSRLPFDRLQTLKMPRRPFACIALCRSGVHASGTPAGKSHHKATAMAQGIPPAAAMASYRRSRLPFDRLQTLKMPRRPFACIALCRSGVHASGTPAGKSHHKATAMAQGIPAAAAMASYRRSRLPFDRLQTLKMPRRPFACIALCRSGVHASGTPAGKSHHKATAMAQGIPPAAAMASYRRSRLPFDRLQTLKMPRRPFACIALCRSGVHASGTPAGKSHHKATAMAQGIGRSNGFL